MTNKYILESLASDLKRVALGLNRGSNVMAQRFLSEALKRRDEVNMDKIPSYLKNILSKIGTNTDAENALMYSTLIQNYALSNMP